jgi:hypothetical protein
MNARVRTTAPARRLGDEWIWVGFGSALPSCSPAEHAGLELERLHVDELARLLLQAAEFQLRGAHGAWPRAEGAGDRWDTRALEVEARRSALEFEAWLAALDEQLAALHADGASLSPRLATLVAACLAAADAGAQTFERAECSTPAALAADSLTAAPKQREGRFAASAGALPGRAQGRSDRACLRGAEPISAHAGSVAATSAATVTSLSTSTVTSAPATFVPSDAARDAGRDAAGRRSAAESERWPVARDLAQAARVLAPSARSHCALGRAQLAAGDAAAARGCFRAALASTADVRLQREAQLALDELCRTPRLSSAVGAEALGVSHVDVPHF